MSNKIVSDLIIESSEQTIKNFLTQMATQDNRGTRFPLYYVIRTEVEDQAPTENCDYTKFYYDSDMYLTMEAFEESMKRNGLDEEELEAAKDEVVEVGIKKRWEERCMFLTEQDAENHLKLNHYHYTKNAHTYVKHAWRAPWMEEFFSVLFNYFEVKKP